jgi:hypothetical protein
MPPQPGHLDPSHNIDPAHNGDGRAVTAPNQRDGKPVTEKPFVDKNGRSIPPDHTQIGRIGQDDFRNNIRGIEGNWDRNDHGYHWSNWGGWNVCHYYDTFGFHWWGFYNGGFYFWTRYFNDNYWWWDPYWHRWVYLNNGQWWWQGPDGVYLYTGGWYYNYGPGDGGVILTPDPSTPVDVPPGGDTPPANQTAVYSDDGTRSIQIIGDTHDAYLYNLTITDSSDPAAQGVYLASQVTAAAFVNDASGAVSQVVLTVTDDAGNPTTETFDANGNAVSSANAAFTVNAAKAPTAAQTQTLLEKVSGSQAFKVLQSGNFGW